MTYKSEGVGKQSESIAIRATLLDTQQCHSVVGQYQRPISGVTKTVKISATPPQLIAKP